VREWGGHGLGRNLHEPPSVSHTGPAGHGPVLRPGMVFTIEPMINAGRAEWKMLKDGWTVVTADGSLSAQFEHTIVITDHGPEILSRA
jgi:methionyl aminopeptidase